MTQTKKELIFSAFDNKPVDRIPTGFWFHILPVPTVHKADAFTNPAITDTVLAGEEKYIDTYKPDYVKIMTDGFFTYQNEKLAGITSVESLKSLQPLADDDIWFTRQIDYAKALSDRYGNDITLFYNIFAAATTLKFMLPDGDNSLAALIKEDAGAVKNALSIISKDLAKLSKRLISEGGVTGIYLSLQNILADNVTKAVYDDIIAPGEKEILAAANSASPYNILHICGYHGHHNDLTWYKDYDVKAINWAVKVEGISLEEGKKIFAGRAVIGGFGNTETDVLYSGTKEEVETETKKIIQNAGTTGILLGADCTVPQDISWERFDWVREAAQIN